MVVAVVAVDVVVVAVDVDDVVAVMASVPHQNPLALALLLRPLALALLRATTTTRHRSPLNNQRPFFSYVP